MEADIAREQMRQPLLSREQIVAWLERFRYGNFDDTGFRQRLTDAFINFVLDKLSTTGYNLIVIKRALALGIKGGCM